MSSSKLIKTALTKKKSLWLITGVSGFIGSNLLEALLELDQEIIGIDNLSTGNLDNLSQVKAKISERQWKRFKFVEGDICNIDLCREISNGVDYVLHQAALGSVPRSIKDPIATNESNITGFLNVLTASHESNVKSFTYAASSSTYGDHPDLPKVEERIGKPLSPYAVSKYVNELYAEVFARVHNFRSIGLRYFNVFGRRQDPKGPYSAVIPKWITAMLQGEQIFINGDGETSRDFCYIDNVVQANILAALAKDEAKDQIYNVAVGERTSLNELFQIIKQTLASINIEYLIDPVYGEFREGDIKHSLADISKAQNLIGYSPKFSIQKGMKEAIPWYVDNILQQ